VRLLARNPEPKSVVYDPISLRVGTGKLFWPSRGLNRVIRGLIRLISELAVISIHLNRVSEQLVHDKQGARRKPSFTYPEGSPAAIVAFCRERLVSYKVPARLAFRTAAQLPRSPGAAPRRSGKSRRASGSVAALPRRSTAAATISGIAHDKGLHDVGML
jgi:acyl-CoA synthetase (AMP-forming)/AMP-acid ligase II